MTKSRDGEIPISVDHIERMTLVVINSYIITTSSRVVRFLYQAKMNSMFVLAIGNTSSFLADSFTPVSETVKNIHKRCLCKPSSTGL